MQNVTPQQDKKPSLPRVIAISSGKGGVGKSSISVNLGISLAKKGARVCLLDADTGLANANILLGLTAKFSLEHVLYGAKSIEEVMLDAPHGLKIIPGANGISDCITLHPRQQLRLTSELARIEGDFDFLLIDTAAGIADNTLDFVSAAHHTLVVITPEPTSLTDAFSLIKLLKRRRDSIHYHVVVNMCSSAGQAKEVYHRFNSAVEKYIGVKSHYLGHILRDESMRAAVVLQNPVSMFPATDPSCRSFMTLADNLDNATRVFPVLSSFSAYWHRQFREHRSEGGRKPLSSEIKPLSDELSTKDRDADYLSELRSRILLLIEKGDAEPALIESMLQESVEAFSQRFEYSAIDPLGLVEEMVACPERNDQRLRDLAERIKPWVTYSPQLPLDAMSLQDLADADKDQLPAIDKTLIHFSETLPPFKIGDEAFAAEESADELPASDYPANDLSSELGDGHIDGTLDKAVLPVEPEPAEPGLTGHEVDSATVSTTATTLSFHGYNATRFGSQEHLLEMIRKQDQSERPLVDLLASLA